MSLREDAVPRPTRTVDRYVLTEPGDAQLAADALAKGGIVAHGFANFYVITTRPDPETVRRVNVLKGHPPDQVGSITTTPSRIPLVFDWSRLPTGLTRSAVLGLMDALFECGPFGFRGPARRVPDHLTQLDEGVRTAQLVVPGYRCPSNDFLARALDSTGGDLLYVTSANRAGADEEPAHYRADGLRADFGDEPGFMVLEHANEDAARLRYSGYAPMSTSILAFHKLADGCLVMERHGGLHVDDVRAIAGRLGFDVVLGPNAQQRLPQHEYDR